MLITLIVRSQISTLSLPEKIRGQHWICSYDHNHIPKPLISVEAHEDRWEMKSNHNVKIISSSNQIISKLTLTPGHFYDLKILNEDTTAFVFTEPATKDRQFFTKYRVNAPCKLYIGRSADCHILYKNNYVNVLHARLTYDVNGWSISDLSSVNGTYVNGKAIPLSATLSPGDHIFIMGLRIIIGKDFLALNNPDGHVELQTDLLTRFEPDTPLPLDPEAEEPILATSFFHRPPRFKRDIKPAQFRIDSPPSNQVGDAMPMMLAIGPSVTMGLAAATTGAYAVFNAISSGNMASAIPSAVMSASMLLGTMLWPILSKSYEKKRKAKREALRQEKYTAYLENLRDAFLEESRRQTEILSENSILPQECISRIMSNEKTLWERSPGQDDFLEFRLGLGNRPLLAEVTCTERKFTLDDDNLLEEMHKLNESPKLLNNVPISLSLLKHPITGIVGPRETEIAFVKGMILQLATLHSYDEVKCIFLYDLEEDPHFSFTKWLPHSWDNDRSIRFVATNLAEVKNISAYMEHEIDKRKDLPQQELSSVQPYYVIFALSRDLSRRTDTLRQLYEAKKYMNISVVTCFDELRHLPKECSTVVDLQSDSGKLYNKFDISGHSVPFSLDTLVREDLDPVARHMSNIFLDLNPGGKQLPNLITFLQLFGVGKVEHLNSLIRWKENNPTKSLETPVGVTPFGDTFMLDLHEKFHGPHGLVAGMTGSGKSEFIISYILSLAVNFHPHEVSFILIDYKGGGMAKSFENLPHTVGIITNLDGPAIKRSLLSIESELLRRQSIFQATSKKIGTSNIDIYKYQKLYREGSVTEPMSHLFIISDEFAELKSQKPEFMAQLISTARIGRSLGVHLILATQKPAGVVDDQIWSNSKFRVCLKVQDRSDSMDMLKRPDAAELSQTGRFYLQVGYNEMFELGQAAWGGASYEPSDYVVTEKDDSVVFVDRSGSPIRQLKANKSTGKKNQKQLDVITAYLHDIAEDEGLEVHNLWLDPIPERIFLDQLAEKYSITPGNNFILNPLVGEYDDPRNQRQMPLTLPLSAEGNAIIYGSAGNGKSTFLNALVYSLITNHTPEGVNLYLLDFASETLRAFAAAPHVGDVILSHEAEKITNLFKMLHAEIDLRKKRFSDYGGDYQSYITVSGDTMPNIVVAINNFAAFVELYEDHEEDVALLSREGCKYGIYFVLTATGTNSVRFRLMQNFNQMITLQLNDETDYVTVVGKSDGVFPSKYKGRGLVKVDTVCEFQTAQITDSPVPFRYIQNYCQTLRAGWTGPAARKVPLLPDRVNVSFLKEYLNPHSPLELPLGVETHSLEIFTYPLSGKYMTPILSVSEVYADFLRGAAELLAMKGLDVTVVDAAHQMEGDIPPGVRYCANAADCNALADELFSLTVHRHNTTKIAKESGRIPEEFPRKVIIICSLAALEDLLEGQRKEKLELILERGDSAFNMTVLLGDTVKNLSLKAYTKWYKRHIAQIDGLWIGDGFTEQYQLKASKTTPEMRQSIGDLFGFALRKGNAVKIKVLRHYIQEDA